MSINKYRHYKHWWSQKYAIVWICTNLFKVSYQGIFWVFGLWATVTPLGPRALFSGLLWLQPHLPWWHVMGAQIHLVLTAPAQASMELFWCYRSLEVNERELAPLLQATLNQRGTELGGKCGSLLSLGAVELSPQYPKASASLYVIFPSSFPTLSLQLLRTILDINPRVSRQVLFSDSEPRWGLWQWCTGRPWMYISAIDLLISSGSIPRIVHCWVKGQRLLKTSSDSALFSRVPHCKSIDCILFACAVQSQSGHEGSR